MTLKPRKWKLLTSVRRHPIEPQPTLHMVPPDPTGHLLGPCTHITPGTRCCVQLTCAVSLHLRLLGATWCREGGRGRARQAACALFFPQTSAPEKKQSAQQGSPAQGPLEQAAWNVGPASPGSPGATGGGKEHDPWPSPPLTLEVALLGGSTASGHHLVCPHSDPTLCPSACEERETPERGSGQIRV